MTSTRRNVLNVFPEMLPARERSTGRFPFLYPRQVRKPQLAEDFVIYDQVVLRTLHFHELSWISAWLPFDVLKELLESEAIKLVWDPWLLSSSRDGVLILHGASQSTHLPLLIGGRVLDVCGQAKTIGDKVIEAFQEISPYNKQEMYQIADLVEQSTVEASQHHFQDATDAAEADLASNEFLSSCHNALTGKVFNRSDAFPYDRYVILTNIYLTIMAQQGISYLRGPQIIQKIVMHKSRWLGKKFSTSEEVIRNLSTFCRVVGVPNIRELFQRRFINETNLLEVRAAAKEFREWLHSVIESQRSICGDDSAVLRAYIKSLEKISAINSLPVKTLRFVITSSVGLIPVIGNIASIGLSAFDTFLLEKLVEGWQPKIFVDKLRKLSGFLAK